MSATEDEVIPSSLELVEILFFSPSFHTFLFVIVCVWVTICRGLLISWSYFSHPWQSYFSTGKSFKILACFCFDCLKGGHSKPELLSVSSYLKTYYYFWF